MNFKLPDRFLQVISFYVLLTLLPIIAFEFDMFQKVLSSPKKVGDMYALLSVLVGVMWHIVGDGYVKTGNLEIIV